MCKCIERSIEPNKLKANGDKVLKECHVEYGATHNKGLAHYSVTTQRSPRAASTFKRSLFRSIRAECNKHANCYFQVLLITSPLCVQRGHVVAQRKRRTGGCNVYLLIIPYIIKPFALPVIKSDSLRQHCKLPQIHSLIEHTVITVKLSSAGAWNAMGTI